MVSKKIVIAACFASALTMVAAPASAAAYLIGGKWYFFSLDYDATLKKVTGKELNAGLTVTSDVLVTGSQILCGNPQGNRVDPGNGPTLSTSATSDPLDPTVDVVKSDRSKSTFKKLVQVDLNPAIAGIPCDSPANSLNGEWKLLYWQNTLCDRGAETQYGVMCYSDFAYKKDDGYLYYTGSGNAVGNESGWTFVYLPTGFDYVSTVNVDGIATSAVKGTCTFANNTNGKPYSLKNPPLDGWANARTLYACSETPVTLP